MSKISELITTLCPEGVNWVRLCDICQTVTPPVKLKTNQYLTSGPYLIIDQGQDYCAGYTDLTESLLPLGEYVLYGDHTCIVKYVDSLFAQGADGLKILKAHNDCLPKYLYYALIKYNLQNTEYKRHWTQAKEILIPLPPLAIQQEIVRILDSFAQMQSNLEAELAARLKQYQYYRDNLYSEDLEKLLGRSDCEIRTIGDLGSLTRGKRFVRTDIVENGVPCIHYGDMYTYYGLKAETANTHITAEKAKSMRFANKGDVVIVGAGENDWDIGVGLVWQGEEPAAIHDACYILEHSQDPMYISHYLRSTVYHLQLRKYVSSGKISSFAAKDLAKIYIPIPSLIRQQEIVSILDTFEALITNIKNEIEARKKQYEYYREKLLTF